MWIEKDNQLTAVFKFRDFVEAFAFMTEVAFQAEKQNHHPNWSNVWNTVTVHLSTHDAGNIVTEKDRRLAADLYSLAGDQFRKRFPACGINDHSRVSSTNRSQSSGQSGQLDPGRLLRLFGLDFATIQLSSLSVSPIICDWFRAYPADIDDRW